MVLWRNQIMPADYEIRFGITPFNVSMALNIVFFGATGVNCESIFDLSLPVRQGIYASYTKGAIKTYSESYIRVNPDGSFSGLANVRKNPGFNLVASGVDQMARHGPPGHVFEVVVQNVGGNMTISVDGRREVGWIDNGTIAGPAYNRGFVGLRQMAHGTSAIYTHFDVYNLTVA